MKHYYSYRDLQLTLMNIAILHTFASDTLICMVDDLQNDTAILLLRQPGNPINRRFPLIRSTLHQQSAINLHLHDTCIEIRTCNCAA